MASRTSPSVAEILNGLESYLKNEAGMDKIAEDMGLKRGEFRNAIRDAYKQDYILIKPPEDEEKAKKLNKKWKNVRYHILKASGDHFFQNTARVFFEELNALLEEDGRDRKKALCLGIVSGRTSGGMVEAICSVKEEDWPSFVKLDLLPKRIEIYALNVSQTDGYDELKGNANILAYQLAHQFQAVASKSTVEAFGLSAAILQSAQERQKTDCSKTTMKVLSQTDPKRLAASLKALKKPVPDDLPGRKSQLDVVITGVGSKKDSFFEEYCKDNDIDYSQFARIVGDIAYSPVTIKGKPQPIHAKDNEELEFYCAVSLDVLREMSSDPLKRVIVVARNSRRSNKIDIIHAAICSQRPLCNVLLTDDGTAHELYVELGR